MQEKQLFSVTITDIYLRGRIWIGSLKFKDRFLEIQLLRNSSTFDKSIELESSRWSFSPVTVVVAIPDINSYYSLKILLHIPPANYLLLASIDQIWNILSYILKDESPLQTKIGFHCRVIFTCVNIPSYRQTPEEQINVLKTELSIDGARGKLILKLEIF